MSVTLSYDSTLSRVRITATGMGSATTAVVQRSTDQIAWTTVRGGAAAPVSAGALVSAVDDYEFAADVLNYYRVVTPAAPSFVAAGTAAHGDNAALDPGLPAGLAQGDGMLLFTAIRNTAGTVVTPAGWSDLITFTHAKLMGKIAGASESAPHVTYTGGSAGDTTSAQVAAVRNVTMNTVLPATQSNASAQNIATPQLTFDPVTECLVLWIGWKQDDWTSVAPVANGTEIGEPSSTTGNDQGLTWDYWSILPTTAFSVIGSRTFTVTGGGSAISKAGVTIFEPSDLVQTNSITPTLSTWWLKSVARPFLNTPVVPLKPVPIVERRARQGVFEIVGRSMPVAVTDVRASKEYVLQIVAESDDERDRVDLILSSGEPVFFHAPADSPRPSMYAVIGDTSHNYLTDVFTLPLREVAAPGPDIVGSTATWQTVINTYATWADLIAAKATWADLLELVGDPSEVIVP